MHGAITFELSGVRWHNFTVHLSLLRLRNLEINVNREVNSSHRSSTRGITIGFAHFSCRLKIEGHSIKQHIYMT